MIGHHRREAPPLRLEKISVDWSAAWMLSADAVRRQVGTSAPHPSRIAKSPPTRSDSASDAYGVSQRPLSVMARWNRPALAGDTRCAHTLTPPADSPKIVTFAGSPPKLAMFA